MTAPDRGLESIKDKTGKTKISGKGQARPLDGPMIARELQAPRIVIYYKIYAAGLVLTNVLTLALGILLAAMPERFVNQYLSSPDTILVLGSFLIVVGTAFIILPAVSLFPSNKPWAWGYNLAIIIAGLFFGCMMLCPPAGIVCVPLAFAWFKPEVRAWYDAGRPDAPYGDYTGPDANYDFDAAPPQAGSHSDGNPSQGDETPPNPY